MFHSGLIYKHIFSQWHLPLHCIDRDGTNLLSKHKEDKPMKQRIPILTALQHVATCCNTCLRTKEGPSLAYWFGAEGQDGLKSPHTIIHLRCFQLEAPLPFCSSFSLPVIITRIMHAKPFPVKHTAVRIDKNEQKSLKFYGHWHPSSEVFVCNPKPPKPPGLPRLFMQNVKGNRYHCASARTVSAQRLSAILALEIVVQKDYFDRKIEGEGMRKRQGTRVRGIQETYSWKALSLPETWSVLSLPDSVSYQDEFSGIAPSRSLQHWFNKP